MQLEEKFHRPENWDKVSEGPGYVLYAGGDDWHVSATSCWACFSSDESNRRIWFTLKFPDGCVWDEGEPGSHKDDNQEKCKKHSEKVWRAWLRAAKSAHANRNKGSRSWKDAFKAALRSKEMQPYVKEYGEETTHWDEVKEARVRSVVGRLLEADDGGLQRYVDEAGFRTFNLYFDFGACESGNEVNEVKVPRYLLAGLGREAMEEKIIDYVQAHSDVYGIPKDDWTWLVEIYEVDPVGEVPESIVDDPAWFKARMERLRREPVPSLEEVSAQSVAVTRARKLAESNEPSSFDGIPLQRYVDELPAVQRTWSMRSPVSPGDGMTAPCRVVLRRSLRAGEWVTRVQNMQTNGEFWGHYADDYAAALEDFKQRCAKLGVDWNQSEQYEEEQD